MDTTDPPPRCGTCKRFARHADDRLSAVSGFGNCALLPRWKYVSAPRRCRFDPPKWERTHAVAKT
ncbi:hypothetical protein [Thauera sp. 2A1]|uniref:hypothetical protein n=1 Tax=Thauera sp. 2A1 TaxID=2570191 RepID=UPI0018851F28|nr:hypothetical protein [Thauera sp. 2A1]KAI5914589.1 hypothetical protein GH664_11630 [Thauera sp. 2A1]